MIRDVRTAVVGLVFAATAATVSCRDDVGPEDSGTPSPILLSNPVPFAASAGGQSLAALSSSDVAYVSLRPGAYPTGVSITVTNRRTSNALTVAIVDGGFDPVPIAAEVGDTLAFAIDTGETPPALFERIVPQFFNISVVRTDPGGGNRDVPLNSRMRVIFSEPVDPVSVTGTTLRLVVNGSPVEGEVGVFDGGLGAFFQPATELLPETGYTLVVGDGIKDTDGGGLKSPVSVAFTTSAAGDPVALRFEQPPADAISGMPLRSSVVVIATDAAGRLAAGFTGQVTLTIGANPGGAVLHGATSGVGQSVEFGDLRLDAPGDGYTLVAGSPGLPSVTSSAFDVVPARDLIAVSTWESDKFPWDFRLFVLSADGRGAARIPVPFWAQGPDWSPDGTKIAFGRKGGGVVSWWDSPAQPLPDDSLYVINADGTSLRSLNRGGQDPRWSPDGRHILYSRVLDANGQPDYEIQVMNADGTGVGSLGQKGTGASWSPDGTRIAFTSELELPDSTRPHEIYVMNADGSGAKSLGIRGEFPVWSPDGSKLVFSRDSLASGAFVYVVNADGSGIVNLTAHSHTAGDEFSEDLYPDWSPDGSRIAYTRYDVGAWPVEKFLHVMNADGSGDARIPVPDGAPEFGSAWQLDWSPLVVQPHQATGMSRSVK